MSDTAIFPADFVWGAATASYQVEGAVAADGRTPSIWDRFCASPGKVFRGQTGEVACDHYHRYREDVGIMKELGLLAYRFSISWPRVMPGGGGKVNAAGLDFYSRLVDSLLEAGIAPWATLYHWDLPWELQMRGGWLSRETADRFADYAASVVDALSDRVAHWMTMNEPQVFIGLGYGSGLHAPGWKLSLAETLRAAHHALVGHGEAVGAIRDRAKKTPRVGWAPVAISYYPAGPSAADVEAARAATFSVASPGGHSPEEVYGAVWNSAWWMDPVFKGAYPAEAEAALAPYLPPIAPGDMDLISRPLDFLGVNHYHAEEVRSDGRGGWEKADHCQGIPTTTMRWDVTPDSIYWAAKFLHERYGKPIYFTENGIATTDFVSPDGSVRDEGRVEFMRAYLKSLGRAVAEGIPVKGYFAWSLMDNFEWAEGYAQRFGLVRVDYATQARTVKESGRFYRKVIESRGAAL